MACRLSPVAGQLRPLDPALARIFNPKRLVAGEFHLKAPFPAQPARLEELAELEIRARAILGG